MRYGKFIRKEWEDRQPKDRIPNKNEKIYDITGVKFTGRQVEMVGNTVLCISILSGIIFFIIGYLVGKY